MIPKLSDVSPIQAKYLDFLEQLKVSDFAGDIHYDYANRVALSTDNSIYQVLPQGVIYPKTTEDIITLVKLIQLDAFNDIVLAPRGSGTSYNGQSLTDGLLVDLSKYMNKVLEINVQEGWARVQAGALKGQLNKEAKAHNLFLASGLSNHNRSTIGGMISTDASGQGSVVYGKTRDQVLELNTVLLDGSLLHSYPIGEKELAEKKQEDSASGYAYRLIDSIFNSNQKEINKVFPKLSRSLTGYDLANIRTPDNKFDLNAILCGSEGTLGFIVEAKIKLLPIPKHTLLVNIVYDSIEASLRHANTLAASSPTSIQTIDSHIVNLAKEHSVWPCVAEFFPEGGDSSDHSSDNAVSIVEYTGNNLKELKAKVKELTATFNSAIEKKQGILGHSLATTPKDINNIWRMREKAVALLGHNQNSAQPISFIEDTVVPTEKLTDYTMELRTLLDSYKVQYGMFGHADAGVMHVHPIIDLKIAKNKRAIRNICDDVVALTQKYGGLLWGQHGKGFRSQYVPDVFGALYPVIQQVKTAFDPKNQLNPGKVATPFEFDAELYRIDKVPLRGQFDHQISLVNREQFKEFMPQSDSTIYYNVAQDKLINPLLSLTQSATHTPKGRAALTREWLRGISNLDIDTTATSEKIKKSSGFFRIFPKTWNSLKKRRGDYDFSNDVYDSMTGCFACESCAEHNTQMNVTDNKATFLELYHARYLRPLRHRFITRLESMLPTLFRFKGLYNGFIKMNLVKNFLERRLGLINVPTLSTHNVDDELNLRGVRFATSQTLKKATPYDRHKLVIIIQDAYTSYLDVQLVLDTMEFLSRLGFNAYLAPYVPNGKQQHNHGFLKAFEKTANKHLDFLDTLSQFNIPLVGLDSQMTQMYRLEYQKRLGDKRKIPKVHLLQEWLVGQKEHLAKQPFALEDNTYHLLADCTETENAPTAIKDWEETFSLFGLSLAVEHMGCSGVNSPYGHEVKHLAKSKEIYDLSWSIKVNDAKLQNNLVATSYSCRAQVASFDQQEILHPLQAILKHIKEAAEV